MANHIDDATIEYVGILAKLELSGEEKEQTKKDMESMLDYVDKLNELDTSSVEPMSHVFPVKNVFREDVVTNGDGSEDTRDRHGSVRVRRTGAFRRRRRGAARQEPHPRAEPHRGHPQGLRHQVDRRAVDAGGVRTDRRRHRDVRHVPRRRVPCG